MTDMKLTLSSVATVLEFGCFSFFYFLLFCCRILLWHDWHNKPNNAKITIQIDMDNSEMDGWDRETSREGVQI